MKLVDYQCPVCGQVLEDVDDDKGSEYYCGTEHERTKMNRIFGYAMLKVGIRKSILLGPKAKGRFTKFMPSVEEVSNANRSGK